MTTSGQDAAPRPAAPLVKHAAVYAISLVLAGCSLLYELLIAQTLTLIAGNMVVWYSLTIGTYLAAMGFGAILYGAPVFRGREAWRKLFRLEIVLSVVGGSTVLLLHAAHTLHLYLTVNGVIEEVSAMGFYGVCFAVTFLVGTLTGIELPLLIDIGNAVVPGREVTNRVLGWDYIGALGGGVVFPLFLVPNFELHTIGFAVAVVNLAVALFIAVRVLPGEPNHAGRLAGGIAFTVLLVAGMLNGATIEQFILKKYYFYFETAGEGPGSLFDPLSRMPDVRRSSSPYQKIDMVHYPTPWDPITEAYSSKFVEDPDRPRDRYLFLNGDRQLGSNFEELYHEWFAHVPIIATGAVPRRVLIMGGGDGILHRELFKYDEVESVTHVDIDFRLVAMAKHDSILTAINEHALDDPRNHTIFADAYKWIREYDGPPFDAVYLDFPVARDYNLSRLFTREFYTFVATHLVEHGFLVMDAPRLWLWTNDYRSGTMETYPAGTWDIHSNTLRSAGFHTVVPFYSNLEADNPAARRALASSNKLRRAIAESNGALASAEAQQQWIEDYLGRMWRLRMGFLYARKDRRNGPFEYHDFGIKLHLLNEKRFDLALPVHVEFEHDIDMSKVNSIMRPRLPRGDLTDIRASW